MSNFIETFLNNLQPPAQCLLCGEDSGHTALCEYCTKNLPWLPALHCPQCALPILDGGLCGACLKAPPAFGTTQAAFLYHGAIAHLIPAAKFGTRWSLLPALAKLMLPTLSIAVRPDLIIPLPLHPARLKERGFNQALEIAKPLAKALELPLQTGILLRIRDTEHQVRLNEKARHRNVHEAFLATGDVNGKRIALVDDVMTTGASLNAAARALKKAGAIRVDAWVLARTPQA